MFRSALKRCLEVFREVMRRNAVLFSVLGLLLVGLFALDLLVGAMRMPLSALWGEGLEHQIMLSLRLPKAVTAVLAGASLALSGLMMQTLFRNPLAGPYILGVSSGATLGVATLILFGTLLGFAASSAMTVTCAILGSVLVLLLVMAFSYKIKSNVTLLIVGMMIGSVAGALVNVMQNFANPDSLKLFIVWTLGSLSAVSWQEMCWLLPIILIGVCCVVALIKPLNGLVLGEQYAEGLGVNIRRIRFLMVVATGLLAGGITAFCGPIAFVGVAVPHIARGLFRTSNHHLTVPATALVGANLLLVCDAISSAFTYPLPISTVSALFGAPIVVYVVLKK